MHLMLAYDHSRNARIALDHVKRLFGGTGADVTVISVVEEPGSTSSGEDDLFAAQYREQKAGVEEAAVELSQAGFSATVLLADGDARGMILRATHERTPDLLVLARHSHKPDGNFITRRLDAIAHDLDQLSFGSVSAFLLRNVNCPLLIVPTHE